MLKLDIPRFFSRAITTVVVIMAHAFLKSLLLMLTLVPKRFVLGTLARAWQGSSLDYACPNVRIASKNGGFVALMFIHHRSVKCSLLKLLVLKLDFVTYYIHSSSSGFQPPRKLDYLFLLTITVIHVLNA